MASLPSTASAGFQTDVPRRNAAPQAMLDRPFVAHQDPGGRGNEAAGETGAGASGSSGYLDNAVEGVNRQIDNDIKALLDAFDALVELSGVGDFRSRRWPALVPLNVVFFPLPVVRSTTRTDLG